MSVETPEAKTPVTVEKFVVRLKFFGLVTCRPEQFVEKLEKLCQEFVDSPEEYSFSWQTDFATE